MTQGKSQDRGVTSSVPLEVRQAVEALGVSSSEETLARLSGFLDQLLETNRAFNLTAITDRDEAWHKHVVDSLTLTESLRGVTGARTVLDVGSGGGLPAIPLAIALPELSFTLLEATGKKARFLAETSRLLGLNNVSVVEERAETYGRGEGREAFDIVTSRAVSRLPVLLELTLPFLRKGGVSFALKGEQAEQEVAEARRALSVLGGNVRGLRRTNTGTIITIDKVAPTPSKYPRRPGEPKRVPLM